MSIKFGKVIKTLSVGVVILVAVTLSALRFWLPHFSSYRGEVEAWLSLRLGHPVKIGAMSAEMRGLGAAALRFTDVMFLSQTMRVDGAAGVGQATRVDEATRVEQPPHLDQAKRLPLFSFHEVVVEVDLWRSLLALRPQFGPLTLVGVELEVSRESDGSLRVAGIPAASSPGAGADQLGLDWLLDRDYISLVNSSVRWRDKRQGDHSALTFSNMRLAVIKEGRRHRIGGEIGLPAELGNSLTFKLDANGDLRDAARWSGTAYMVGQGLQLAPLRALLTTINMPVVEGALSGELWMNWRAGTVVSTVGSAHIRAPVIRGELAHWDAAAASADFNWRVISGGWLLNVSRWQLDSADAADTPSTTWVLRRTGGDQPIWDVAAKRVQLQPIGRIALAAAANLLSAEQREALQALQIQGRASDAYLRVAEHSDDQTFYLHGAFSDVGFHRWRKLPSMSGLDGRIEATSQAAMVHMNSERAQIEIPDLFREPLRFDRLTGDIVARKNEASWTVWSEQVQVGNDDIRADGSFQLLIPQNGSSELDLAANFSNGHATATPRYLPVGVLPAATVAWLDRAIVAGNVPAGAVIFRGPLDQFPFSRAQGRFEVRFAVEDGVLDYAARWPRLEQLFGEVVFSERSMRILGQRARILDATLTDVRVDIEELSAHRSILQVKGRGGGPAATGLAFLTATPLADTVGQRLRGWKGDGPLSVDLEMRIPLRAGADNDVAGTIQFDGAELTSEDAQVDIQDMRGTLHFGQDGIRGNAVSATVLSQPALVDVETTADGTVWFNAVGTTSGASLAERFNADILRWLQGPLSWRGSLRLPNRQAGAPAEVQIYSDLQNVMINAPYPVGKSSKERRDSEVKVLLNTSGAGSDGIIPINVRYGNNVSAVLALHHQQDGWRPRRADVRIGRGSAQMPSGDGIHLFARLDKLDLDAWRETLLPTSTDKHVATQRTAAMALSEADFEIGQVQWLSRRFNEVHVGVVRGPDAWNIDVTSDKLAGTVTVPQQEQDPIVVDLTRLYVEPENDRRDSSLEAAQTETTGLRRAATIHEDPRLVRGFRLTADDWRYGEWALGRLQLRAQRVTDGLHFDQVKFGDGPTVISAYGSWLSLPSGTKSQWHIEMRTADMGRTLTDFGFANTMSGGLGMVGLDLDWAGGPTQFNLRALNGEIRIESTQGRLLEVEPGAGRIFGLLSLQALPRRLDLDFSDLFAKGFAFDHIGGKFVLTQGVASTSDMVMEGPAAVVQMNGSVNLVEKSYDHRVKVLPKVTSSLPLAVGVAATPLAGAAAWIAEKILRDPLSDFAQANYRVTGPWQSPLIERVSRETARREETAGDEGVSSSPDPSR